MSKDLGGTCPGVQCAMHDRMCGSNLHEFASGWASPESLRAVKKLLLARGTLRLSCKEGVCETNCPLSQVELKPLFHSS